MRNKAEKKKKGNIRKVKAEELKKKKKKNQLFPYRESNPGRLGENQES